MQAPDCDTAPGQLPVAQALARILAETPEPNICETLPLRDALGRVAAAPMAAAAPVPNHTNAAMDGFALAASPDRLEYELAGLTLAGKPHSAPVEAGQCVRIMTGGVLPDNCDTVVPLEQAAVEGDRVILQAAPKVGVNVRQAGEDMARGDIAIEPGTRLGAAHLGVAASLGLGEVSVWRRPRVAFFSNGDELRPVGSPLKRGELHDSNRYTLHAMLRQAGAAAIDLGLVGDTQAELEAALRAGSECADLVLTSAGAAGGDADYVGRALAELGESIFHQVAIKPGRPVCFGRVGQALFLGLPGNPVSVMVTFHVFVRPLLNKLEGCHASSSPGLRAITLEPLRKRRGRMEYQRGVFSTDAQGNTRVRSTGEQGSGILSSMARANCFIILGEDIEAVPEGSEVLVQPFDYLL